MKTEENSNKRLGAVLLMAVLAIAVVSTTTIAFSQGGESEETEEEEEEEQEEVEEEIDVEATIVGTSSLAKVKVEFTSSSTDKESLLEEILAKIKLDEATVSNALKIETEEEELQEKLKVKVKIEDGKAEVEFEYRFVIDSTDRETIVNAIVDKLQTLELDEADIELKVEVKAEAEVKGEYKARATKAAKEARQAAEVKDKPEVVENIGHAERYFGKADKAVVALKIGLESDDIESISFGSAQLILIKFGEQEPKFRAVINILIDTEFDTLTACLDGESIGELEIIPTSEELGLYIGHLRETLTGVSISIPGVTAYVVEGADCSATPILSGSI